MNNNKRNGGVWGKSYYIALALCAAAIGIVGFLYYQNDESEAALQEPVSDVVLAADPTQEHVAAVATQGSDDQAEGTTAPPEKGRLKTGAPVSGETVMDYAMDCLSYNETTRDWRTHSGIDIAAEAGTEVRAAADGTVYTTYTDDLYGSTVVIRHEGGYTTQYSSLGAELSVSAGDTVKLGQVIGCVGETALLETAVGPHVHFSVTCNGASMDPSEFLALN